MIKLSTPHAGQVTFIGRIEGMPNGAEHDGHKTASETDSWRSFVASSGAYLSR